MARDEDEAAINRWRSVIQPGESKEEYLTRVGGTDPVSGKTYAQPTYETRGGELYATYGTTPSKTTSASEQKKTGTLNVVQNAMREVASPGIRQIEQRRQQSISYNESSRQNALQNLGVQPPTKTSVIRQQENPLAAITKKPVSGISYTTRTATTGPAPFISTSGKPPITKTATTTYFKKEPVNYLGTLLSPFGKVTEATGVGLGLAATSQEFFIGKGMDFASKVGVPGVAVGGAGTILSVIPGAFRIGSVVATEGPIKGGIAYAGGIAGGVGRGLYLSGELVQGKPVSELEKGELGATALITYLGIKGGYASSKARGAVFKSTELKIPGEMYITKLKFDPSKLISKKQRPFWEKPVEIKPKAPKNVKPVPQETVFETSEKILGEPKATFEEFGSGINLRRFRQTQVFREVFKPSKTFREVFKPSKTFRRIGGNTRTQQLLKIPRSPFVGGIVGGEGAIGLVGVGRTDFQLLRQSPPGETPRILTGQRTKQAEKQSQSVFDQQGMSYADYQGRQFKQQTEESMSFLIPAAIITTGLLGGFGEKGGKGSGEGGFSLDVPGFPGGGGFWGSGGKRQFGRGTAYTPSLLGLISNKKASKAFKLQGIYSPGAIRGR